MPTRYHNKQKSLQRRFLLILGSIAFVGFLALGLMVMFWDRILPDYGYKKIVIGGLIIGYSVLRFVRILRRDKDEDE